MSFATSEGQGNQGKLFVLVSHGSSTSSAVQVTMNSVDSFSSYLCVFYAVQAHAQAVP
jgi:hypothetical protein